MKSDSHTIYDQTVYQKKIIIDNNQVAKGEKEKALFQYNCGICHKIEIQQEAEQLIEYIINL